MTISSRWGVNNWDDFYWGEGDETGIAWGIEIDWNGDGVFDGSNEADRLVDIQTFRGRKSYLAGSGSGYSNIETGTARLTLKNHDGRYDGWNTDSPLYPNVIEGRDVRIRVLDQASGELKSVFYGVITNIRAGGYTRDGSPTVTLLIEDGWRRLRRVAARVALQENITPDAAVQAVLTAAQWPARWGASLDEAPDSIRYFWSSGNLKAATELERLAQSFQAYFYIDASGRARYLTRTNIAEPVVDFLQAELLKDLDLARPGEYRRNITRVKVHPLSVAASVTLWQLVGSTPTIESGTPLVLWANYTYNSQAVSGKSVVTPAPTTDWTANTSSAGTETDMTSAVTLTFSNLGDTAKLVFTYSGAGTIYLTSAKIRGDALYEISATDVTYPTDTSGIDDPQEFILDLPWQQQVSIAQDFARVTGGFLSEAHPFPTIRVRGRTSLQFTPDLFDLATTTLERLGIDGVSFRVAGIGHQSSGDNCQDVTTTFYLEPYLAGEDYWTWPIENFGVDTIFGW